MPRRNLLINTPALHQPTEITRQKLPVPGKYFLFRVIRPRIDFSDS